MGTILDAEMPEQVIWPYQADCGGLARTRTFSRKSDAEHRSFCVAAAFGRAVGNGYFSGYGQLTLAMVRTRCCMGCSELVY